MLGGSLERMAAHSVENATEQEPAEDTRNQT